jgi:hypothetical protein
VYQRTGGPLGPVLKILYRSWSVQDLKKTKRTPKDLIHDVFKVEAKIKALSVSNCQKQIKKVTAAKSDWRKRKFRSHVVVVCYEFSDVRFRPTRLALVISIIEQTLSFIQR